MPKQPPAASFLDSILAATAPKEETIRVQIPGVEKSLDFRIVTSYSETLRIQKKVTDFITSFDGIRSVPEWKPFADVDEAVLRYAVYMAETSVNTPRLGPHFFVTIAETRANLFEDIKNAINEGQFAIADQDAVDEAKNESSGTSDGATA